MTAYLVWWFCGGAAGILAGLLVLRYRGALNARAVLVYVVAIVGCLYGAKIQYRLRFYSPLEAIAVAPWDLLHPGLHIPLGLVVGFVAAMLACRPLRVPALQMADALAMSGAAMMPIGRMGCLISGCCTGLACPKWLSPICVRASYETALDMPNGADPGGLLMTAHLVHSLPIYFALLGLVTVVLHSWLLRRRVPAGTLIAVGFLVYPLGHLAIEQLRPSSSDRAAVMTAVLVAMIALDAIALLIRFLLQRRAARRSPRVVVPPMEIGATL